MNKTAAIIASALFCLYANPSYGQCQGGQFSDACADADIVWHPISIYINRACRQMKANWQPPASEDAHFAVVSFTIDRQGKPVDIKLKTSSKVQELDKAALDAVQKCTSFGEFPKERHDPIAMEVRFATELPKFHSEPDYDRCVKVLLLAEKEEPVSAELASYPLALEEKLIQLWKFDPALAKSKKVVANLRLKIAPDGSVEQCRLMDLYANDAAGMPDHGVSAAALCLINANKKLLPLPLGSGSRYLFVSFRPRTRPFENSRVIAYKAESPDVKRFSSNTEKLVLSHWRPAPGENLTGGVRLEVTLDGQGKVKELNVFQRTGGLVDVLAAKRALNECLPIIPPSGDCNYLFLDFEADQDPATWRVFHRYLEHDMEAYESVFDSEKTDENVTRITKGTISARLVK